MKPAAMNKGLQLIIDEVVKEVTSTLDPEHILLAGSFGKDAWLYSGDDLMSDFEFVFVCKKSWSIRKKKKLLEKLNERFLYEISLKGFLSNKVQRKVISNYAFKNPGYISLDFYDTFSNPKVIFSKETSALKIPLQRTDIPAWEAWRLFTNRLGDLVSVNLESTSNKHRKRYLYLKTFESIVDAYLIIHKVYEKNISDRIKSFDILNLKNDENLGTVCLRSIPYLRKALIARSEHESSLFDPDLKDHEFTEIIAAWKNYIEKELEKVEFIYKTGGDFYKKYLSQKKLHKKYLGFKYYFNTSLSNFIRLLYMPKGMAMKLKLARFNRSWRHLILLCISSIYEEYMLGNNNFNRSRSVAATIFKSSVLSGLSQEEFMSHCLKFWKYLR
ncbi:MAG: hypothetical protein QNJ57_07465 [Flavobacteriaceae bacterium]|nr:hypothetical protein [Flavobacteriaceae bacterium]